MKIFKAVKSAYIALGSPFMLLLIADGYLLLIDKKTDDWSMSAIVISILLIIYIWLKGFRIEITDQTLSYRDGLYRTVLVEKSEIKIAKHAWVAFGGLRKDLKIPGFLIVLKNGERLEINVKPFSREAISELNKLTKNP